MTQEKILIGVSAFIIIYFLLQHIRNRNYNSKNVIVKKTNVATKTVVYKPVTSPNYVQAHYNTSKIKYF